MEKLNVNQEPPKQAKANKKQQPIKVVYISNPVRVEASPAEFRAVVQELTGRDSDISECAAFPSIPSTAAPWTSTSTSTSSLRPEQPHLGDYESAPSLFYGEEGCNPQAQVIEDLPRFAPPPEAYYY